MAKTKDFVVKTKDFVAKTKDFWQRQRIFYFFFIFATLFPMFTLHTNEGTTYTEHGQMLHWACADIIMRGNPLTDNTEDADTN